MNQIKPYPLWIGHAGDAHDFRTLFDRDIRAVVQLAAEEPAVAAPRELILYRFPVVDGVGNSPELLRLAIAAVASMIEQRIPTLVCCSAGMSRSPAIVAAALSRLGVGGLEECLKSVVELHPADIVPGLWEDIHRCAGSRAAGRNDH